MSLACDPAPQFRVTRRWELTREALEGLLARLDTDPAAAGEKYERLRRSLLKFFSWHQISEADSSVDETLDRIARRLDAGHHIDDVPVFAYGVARMVRLERQRRSAAFQTTSDELLFTQAAPTPYYEDTELREVELRDACLQRCLAELSPNDRDLIVTYYVGTGRERIEGRAQLAAALGLSDNALRHRAQRLRERLRVRAAQYLEQADHFSGSRFPGYDFPPHEFLPHSAATAIERGRSGSAARASGLSVLRRSAQRTSPGASDTCFMRREV